jgi:hypothetical protein
VVAWRAVCASKRNARRRLRPAFDDVAGPSHQQVGAIRSTCRKCFRSRDTSCSRPHGRVEQQQRHESRGALFRPDGDDRPQQPPHPHEHGQPRLHGYARDQTVASSSVGTRASENAIRSRSTRAIQRSRRDREGLCVLAFDDSSYLPAPRFGLAPASDEDIGDLADEPLACGEGDAAAARRRTRSRRRRLFRPS